MLNRYLSMNNTFSYIDAPLAEFTIKDNVKIVQSHGYYIQFKYIKRGKEEIKRLLREDIIEPSNSLFASPAFFREKKNKTLRLVVDYKEINQYIEDDAILLQKK
ncbi:Transposon Tf2-8 polyprotein [Nosema granulosis]|uniref:Transposon Tf2-8 polyprotein n=1 Tax=Nosema granulosis TaxID=83296 RepID=A0A9P6GXP4_9MICR|nr:Transposon Tf2-8 polyprotein [Nosema granulosis]